MKPVAPVTKEDMGEGTPVLAPRSVSSHRVSIRAARGFACSVARRYSTFSQQ